jgi:DNA-binding LytR/AlgR family response regulator
MIAPLTILVVDDEPAQRELLGGFLAKRGWAVELAASGAEALAALRRTPVALVLADYKMPDMNGIEILAAAELGISERVLRYKLQKHGLRAWLGEEGAASDMADPQASPTILPPSSP